ncbi:MAG: nucleotide pyrophosphohydrolase [Spirochaetota bacterium]|nr:MAG: nucleotide pyrophosphohydrolase [Spirochaetota bacterium]
MINSQETVSKFNENHNLHMDAHARLLDLQTELGELSKEYLQSSNYGRSRFKNNPRWEEELGDLCYSLLSLANETNVDIEDALNTSLEKYIKRIKRKQDPGSGK